MREEAKKQLTEEILDETRRECAVQVRNLEQEAKEEALLHLVIEIVSSFDVLFLGF